METTYWHQKWGKNDIAFHTGTANPLLVQYFNELSLVKGSRVFLPLCGKTLDISWLLSQGYQVVGAELSKLAIEQLFTELGVEPELSRIGEMDHYRAQNIDIFGGDIFELSSTILGPVDAMYDRAALVALPEEVRRRYAAHIMEITDKAPQLLICYEYDQSVMPGPPFSISDEEVHQLYQDNYEITFLAQTDVPGGLKGICTAQEKIWLLLTQSQEA
ncbi:MAG: thiopurine S-methyltransferase [Acidobacteria bacterium]|nr:thiopurine S-methyltransferase [Acidobacteriota bacterium]